MENGSKEIVVGKEPTATAEAFLEPPSEDDEWLLLDFNPAATESAPAVPETPKPKPPRVCAICQHPSGNSVGKIKRGRIAEVEHEGMKLLTLEPICEPCGEKLPPEERKRLFKAGYLISLIGEKNREMREFEAAKAYWAAVFAGTAERMPEARKTPEEMLSCGVPGCPRCHDQVGHKVGHFVAMTIGGMPTLLGVCSFQAAALAQCGVEKKGIVVTTKFSVAAPIVEAENARLQAFEKAKSFWLAVAEGEAAVEARAEKTERGDIYRCGVPGCKCREHGDRPVDYFVVLDGQPEMPIAGVCRYQYAALRTSGVKIFAANNNDGMGLARCAKHRNWLLGQAKRAIRDVRRPDGIGGGLSRFRSPEEQARIREEKRRTFEEREAKRRSRQLERAKASSSKAGCGKKASSKKGGKGGGKKH